VRRRPPHLALILHAYILIITTGPRLVFGRPADCKRKKQVGVGDPAYFTNSIEPGRFRLKSYPVTVMFLRIPR
jgi:hypothetical protein